MSQLSTLPAAFHAVVDEQNRLTTIDIFVGPLLKYLTVPDGSDDYCVMQVSIPAEASVPLHGHGDRETFYMLSGELEAFAQDRWVTLQPGDTLDIVDGVKHALRNRSGAGVTFLLVTTAKLGRFFRAIGRPVTGQPLPPAHGFRPAAFRRSIAGLWLLAGQRRRQRGGGVRGCGLNESFGFDASVRWGLGLGQASWAFRLTRGCSIAAA